MGPNPNMTSPFSLCLIASLPQRDRGWSLYPVVRMGRVHSDALQRAAWHGPDVSARPIVMETKGAARVVPPSYV